MKMACKDCRYYQKATGLCRRFPPSRDGFPHVEPDCWCYCFDWPHYIPLPPKENPEKRREEKEPKTQWVFICPQDASVLLEKLFSILNGLSVDEAPWRKDCFALSGALAAGRTVGFVQVDLNVAKVLQGVLNNHLVAHPYEKDQFFAELCRLEDAVAQAESKERA